MADRDEFGAFFVGFLVGAVSGAVVALLFAPQSGEETRAMIGERSIELRDQAYTTSKKYYDEAATVAQKQYETAKQTVATTVEGAKKKVARKPAEGEAPAAEIEVAPEA